MIKTSNVTGRHRGQKQKLPAGYTALSWRPQSYVLSVIFLPTEHPLMRMSYFSRRVWYCMLCLRYLHVFNIQASSSPPMLYFCAKFRFCYTPIAELARREKSRTQSLNRSAYLIFLKLKLSLRNNQTSRMSEHIKRTCEEQTLGLNAVGHLNSACCNISDSDNYK